MKKPVFILLVIAFLFSPIKALTTEIPGNSSYQNKNIGIQVTFPEDWALHTSGETAPDQTKNLFPPDKGPDDSPLFLGMTADQQAFSLLSVEQYDGSIEDYFELLYFTQQNKAKVSEAIHFQDQDTVQWIYSLQFGQVTFSFVEVVTITNGRAVRLTFWTLSPLLPKYQPVFEKIIGQTKFLNDSQGKTQWVGKWHDLNDNTTKRNIDYVEIAAAEGKAPITCGEGERSVIWEVKGDKNTVYLFGSIHLGRPDFYPLDDKIESAFERSKYLVVEVDATSAEAKKNSANLLSRIGMLEGGKTLEDVLSKGVYNKLLENFEQIGLPFDNFKKFKPWLAAVTLSVIKLQSMGYAPDFGVDRYLLEKGAGSKEILELESIEEQFKLLDALDNEQFLAYTMLSLNTMEQMSTKMITAWKCGDLKTLENILFEDYDSPLFNANDIYEKVFFERNRKMVAKIKEYLKGDRNYFVVVGAGHYLSEKGIVSLLKKDGYEVNRI